MQSTNWEIPEKITALHAWRRWAARVLDMLLYSFIINNLISQEAVLNFISESFTPNINILQIIAFVATIILLFLYGVINAILISYFGFTLGKKIFGIKLGSEDYVIKFKQAFKREMLVLLEGLGLGIPVIILITYYLGYKNLIRNKITSWDKRMSIKIKYRTQNLLVTISMILLPLALCLYNLIGFIFNIYNSIK